MVDRKKIAKKYWEMCGLVAHRLWAKHEPSPEYAEAARQLLFCTGAHESGGWVYRRQMGFGRFSDRGAFGLWQQEKGSIELGFRMMQKNPDLLSRAHSLCLEWGWGATLVERAKSEVWDENLMADVRGILQTSDGDMVSCIGARFHYFRIKFPIPTSLSEQAAYAKLYYNTKYGKATADDYRHAYNSWIAQVEEVV